MPESARGLPRDRVRARRLPIASVLGSAGYTLRLWRLLRRRRPDIVHTNSLKAAIYGGIAARAAGVPVVWHVRDRISHDYLPAAAVRLVRLASRLLPDVLIANSEATLATLGRVRRPAHVIPSMVEAAPTEPTASRVRRGEGVDVVGMVGRIATWKGQDVFLRAFAEAFGDGRARAVIVGAPLFGEEAHERELRRLTESLDLEGRVEFKGFREDVQAEIAGFDVLVHASLLPEPFGQVVIEGMAAGAPVVASDAAGPAEVITEGVDGLLYPPGDVEALTAILRRLDADPVLRRRLGEAGRVTARRYAPEAIARRVMAVYQALMSASRRGR